MKVTNENYSTLFPQIEQPRVLKELRARYNHYKNAKEAAKAYFKVGDFDKAKEFIDKAESLFYIYKNYGESFKANYEDAIKQYMNAEERDQLPCLPQLPSSNYIYRCFGIC